MLTEAVSVSTTAAFPRCIFLSFKQPEGDLLKTASEISCVMSLVDCCVHRPSVRMLFQVFLELFSEESKSVMQRI